MYQISYNMSRKERYKQLISEITDAKNTLCAADTEKDVYKALKELVVLFKMYELVSLLDELLAKANSIVDEENKKELSNKLKTLFNQLAEHSDEIAKIIDLSEIFD